MLHFLDNLQLLVVVIKLVVILLILFEVPKVQFLMILVQVRTLNHIVMVVTL